MNLEQFLQLRYRTVLTPIAPEDGGGWLVEAPDLPGCTSDGESPEEALTSFEDARREWFQAMTKEGRAIPLPEVEEVRFSGKFTLRLPRSFHRAIAQAAQREGVSQNQYVLSLMSYGLGVKSSGGPRLTFEQLVRMEVVTPSADILTPLDQIPRPVVRLSMPEQKAKPSPESGQKELGFSIGPLYIEKISAQRFQLAAGDVKYQNSIEIVNIKGERFVLRSTASLTFQGESIPFAVDLQVCGRYLAEEEMTEEKINQNMERLSSPLLNYSSYVTSYLTREMLGVPVVLPCRAGR